MADVPCSGLGALRRRPEARWRRTPADVQSLGGLQRALLAAALDAARPGGVVAYVTCSPHLAETQDVVADVLAGQPGVDVLDAPQRCPRCPASAPGLAAGTHNSGRMCTAPTRSSSRCSGSGGGASPAAGPAAKRSLLIA